MPSPTIPMGHMSRSIEWAAGVDCGEEQEGEGARKGGGGQEWEGGIERGGREGWVGKGDMGRVRRAAYIRNDTRTVGVEDTSFHSHRHHTHHIHHDSAGSLLFIGLALQSSVNLPVIVSGVPAVAAACSCWISGTPSS
jgi:hypothetical protein